MGCLCPPVDEKVPDYPLKKSWKTILPAVENTSLTAASEENWWEVFGDEQLNDIVREGLSNSPTIEQALARFDQAVCLSTIAGAAQYPQLALNGYGDRQRIPKDLQASASVPTGSLLTPTVPPSIPVPNTGVPPIVVPPLAPMVVPAVPEMKKVATPGHVNDLIANFLISYELDFWGKYYLKTQAADRRAEEAEADLATARLLLVDQMASTYFAIQAMHSEIDLIRREIAFHKDRLRLLAGQCEHGLTNAFPFLDEQATLENRIQVEQALLQSKELNESLLAVLMGREPNGPTCSVAPVAWTFPVVPAGLPSSLLAQRPDIRSTVKEVEALIAEIGAAKTELLPSISLAAAAGYQAGMANQWFKWKDRIWSIAASVSQPIFDAGQRFGEIKAAKARFQEAASRLTQTVLTSVKEVEDALVAIRVQKERCASALKREEDFTCTAELRSGMCSTGLQDYLVVLQANEDLFQAKRERVNEEYNLQLGALALMKSLGGSWGKAN